ncbi:MAG: hypothetical protein MUC76_01735 [Spirochaetes bacterium]|jgi:hypothetical protein|nr:hypothetical protein [Spirochaetota bacterium]
MANRDAHIDEKTMRSLLTTGRKSGAVRDHIDRCALCRARYEKLTHVLAPSHGGAMAPSRAVEKRILASYRIIHRNEAGEAPGSNLFNKFSTWNRKALAGAFAAVLIMAGAGITTYRLHMPRALPLYVYSMKGPAFIDGEPVSYQSTIREGSLLEVPHNSVVVLSYKNRFLLKVYERSELRLGKAMAKGNRRQTEFVFNLIKGTLFTRINNESDEPDYFYMTPNARIKSSRTEFILKVAGNKTILIPRSGTINITSLETEEEVLTLPDKKYVITSSIETSETGEYEDVRKQLTDDAENLFHEDEQQEIRNLLEPMS